MTPRHVGAASLLTTATLLFSVPVPLHGQAGWDAVLTIDPYPSPYYSDWDANPNLGTLTVTNGSASAEQVRIHYNVTDGRNRLVVSGVSEPEAVAAGATAIFHSPYTVEGSSTHDSELEVIASRTGRLPEGEYTTCVSVADASGFVLAESCATFTIVYPDPPLLLDPGEDDMIGQGDPLFVWTPVQVPIDYQLSYVFRLVEVLEAQTPADALRSNIPHYQVLDAQSTNLRYPLDARPLDVGKTYAWSVQVLDQNGYAAAANDGRSEIRTFRYDDGTAPKGNSTQTVLALLNDSSSSQPDSIVGIKNICQNWNQPIPRIVFPVTSRFFPSRTADAFLVRDTVAGKRQWAAYNFATMLAGDCGPTGSLTTPRWAALRVTPGRPFAAWLLGDSTQTANDSVLIKYGVAVLSLFEQTISDDALDEVKDFLDQREIDVKPGINLHAVLDAREMPNLWQVLNIVYDDDEHELTGQAFLGLNVNYSARFGLAQEAGGNVQGGAEVLATAEYLNLSLMLPEKKIDGDLIKTVQWGLEITLSDSASKGAGAFKAASGRDLVFKPQVIVVSQNDITWTGSLEIDIGIDKTKTVEEMVTSPKFTVRLTTDHEWQPGPLKGSNVALGHPQIFLDINEGLLRALRGRSAGQIDWDLNGRGAVIWHGEDVAAFGLTVGRKADDPKQVWDDQVKKSAEQVKYMRRVVEDLADEKEKALIAGDTISAANFHNRYQEALQEWNADKTQLHRDSVILAGYEKRYKQNNRTRTMEREKGKFFWQFSVALGNMSLLNLWDLIGNIAEARRGGAP